MCTITRLMKEAMAMLFTGSLRNALDKNKIQRLHLLKPRHTTKGHLRDNLMSCCPACARAADVQHDDADWLLQLAMVSVLASSRQTRWRQRI